MNGKKKNAGWGRQVSWPASGFTGSTWKWIDQAPSRRLSPLRSCQLCTCQIFTWPRQNEHISPLRLPLTRPFDHFRYMYWKTRSIRWLKSPTSNGRRAHLCLEMLFYKEETHTAICCIEIEANKALKSPWTIRPAAIPKVPAASFLFLAFFLFASHSGSTTKPTGWTMC